MNNLGDSFYNTEEVINALDDSDYDLLDGKSFSWLESTDYTSLGASASQWEPYPGTSYKIPFETGVVEYGSEGIDDSEIEFCYDYLNKDIEDSYTEENECTDAGFMWSTDELKNLDLSLSWAWGDYNNDGTNAANLDVFVEYPITDTGSQVFT